MAGIMAASLDAEHEKDTKVGPSTKSYGSGPSCSILRWYLYLTFLLTAAMTWQEQRGRDHGRRDEGDRGPRLDVALRQRDKHELRHPVLGGL